MLVPLIIIPLVTIFFKNPRQDFSSERKIINQEQFRNLIIFKPFSLSIIPVTLLIASYIILTLLTVVKIRKISQGPLRVI